jgi:predicted HTH domain antitoxin
MSIVISEEILQQAHMTEEELRQEIAILLFQKEKLTLAQASKFAGMNRIQFQHLLASRQIPIRYNIEDFNRDLETLRKMDRI